ncbi:bestrophin-4-like isoform X1 [Ptychodera flava]|uniref:bestrophin-4-like isoform X1 n=1 Tax=Ptychodera flava TaxID=63121 RepID=UPI00396A14EC
MGLLDRFLRLIRLFTDKMRYAPKRWRKGELTCKQVRLMAKLGGFYKLLFRWKGSVYKLLWREALMFSFLYAMVSVIYRYVLGDAQKRAFEDFCIYAEEFTSMMPISFVLGFYVSIIVQRWWDQFLSIPWPDKLAYDIAANVYGDDEEGRLLRRTMIRYINLGALLTFCTISKSVKKRFPTIDYIVDAGFMTEHEKRVYEDIPSPHPKHWLPCAWFINLVRKAVDDDRIKSAPAAKTIVDDLNQFHDHCDDLYGFDWVTIPLVYTQVVTIAVYTFFGACLFGRQYLDLKGTDKGLVSTADIQRYNVDYYIPAFTLLQFLFYFGWLKVAENLMNPFGEDDDDFEMNWVVDRNLQVSYLIVDHVFSMQMPLEKDKYWDNLTPDLPYTKIAFKSKTDPWMGSAYRVRMTESDKSIVTNTKKKKDMHFESENNYLRRRNNALERSEDEEDEEMGGCKEYGREASSPILQRHHSNEHLEDTAETRYPRRTSNTSGSPSKVVADFDVVEDNKQDIHGCTVTVTNL